MNTQIIEKILIGIPFLITVGYIITFIGKSIYYHNDLTPLIVISLMLLLTIGLFLINK